MAISYKDSGVDVTAGYKAVELMKKHVKTTMNDNVLGGLGSFGGFYSISGEKMTEPVLVAGTDGVGTKLKYAFILDKHDTIGIDAVAMCVNDIVCQGAKPLFFLDYLAVGKLHPTLAEQVVKGVSAGCVAAGCALIGGETAEMPGFYSEGEYDVAGFSVGIVDRAKIINGAKIKKGDVLIGLASSGIHSNGYSLVRKLLGEDREELMKVNPELKRPLADFVLEPTRIYVKTILSLIAQYEIKGIAHITGGGFIENIPRIFPEGLGCKIDINCYPLPPIFKYLWDKSGTTKEQIYNTFNMGIGMVLAVDPKDECAVKAALTALGETAYTIGEVTAQSGVVL